MRSLQPYPKVKSVVVRVVVAAVAAAAELLASAVDLFRKTTESSLFTISPHKTELFAVASHSSMLFTKNLCVRFVYRCLRRFVRLQRSLTRRQTFSSSVSSSIRYRCQLV